MVEKLENLAEKKEDVQKIIEEIKETYKSETLKEDMVKSTKELPFTKTYSNEKTDAEEVLDYSPCVNAPPCFG